MYVPCYLTMRRCAAASVSRADVAVASVVNSRGESEANEGGTCSKCAEVAPTYCTVLALKVALSRSRQAVARP